VHKDSKSKDHKQAGLVHNLLDTSFDILKVVLVTCIDLPIIVKHNDEIFDGLRQSNNTMRSSRDLIQ
jgi:hypothetical protein